MTDQQTPEKVELLESLTVLEVEEKREMFTLAGDEEVRLYRGVRFFTPGLQIYGSTGGFFER